MKNHFDEYHRYQAALNETQLREMVAKITRTALTKAGAVQDTDCDQLMIEIANILRGDE